MSPAGRRRPPEPARVLLLAGTAEATQVAHLLAADPDVEVTASLAGRTRAPAPLPCPVRVGGFGGVDGLARELQTGGYGALVDATHPFAATMPHHAAGAATAAGVPRLRLLRPVWTPVVGDRWHEVGSLAAAAAALAGLGARRVLLTVGSQDLAPFLALTGVHLVVRSIEPLADPSPADVTSIVARPPFAVADETALLAAHGIDTLVTKNSGGDPAKLTAARDAGIAVVILGRPPQPPGPSVATALDAVAWLRTVVAD